MYWMEVALLDIKKDKETNKNLKCHEEVIHWGCFAGFGRMLRAKVTYLGLWSCWRGKNRERGKILNTGRCKLTSRVKIPTEESVNSREVMGVFLGILRDELHDVTEVFLWRAIPDWQRFREVHPPGLGHLWLYGSLNFWSKGSLPTSQENDLGAPQVPFGPEDAYLHLLYLKLSMRILGKNCMSLLILPIQISFLVYKVFIQK